MASKKRNIVGPQVRKFRDKQGMTQELFAAKCSVSGLEITRGMLSKIEARLRRVSDTDLQTLAKVLKVEIKDLYPSRKR